ncbi:RcnB family protein [Acinetobacter sp. C32I]|uniref:RcnB family protein n=1 Tax=Acinetobacter sp. C32I TaxID=2950074 RepID=UPI002036ABF6|nr:RcnB family protein [Acinetobacter sp. C32I]USA52815.1 RcnB family protein [Acinetobacter sp. C32I]
MKTIAKALILSLSTVVAIPAFAAPHEPQHSPQKAEQQKHDHRQAAHHPQEQKRKIQPAHDWKPGQKVPSDYRGQGYKVDYAKHKNLYKPSKNQQWIKVNGDYVLVNVINHSVIKIIKG